MANASAPSSHRGRGLPQRGRLGGPRDAKKDGARYNHNNTTIHQYNTNNNLQLKQHTNTYNQEPGVEPDVKWATQVRAGCALRLELH